MWIIMFTMFKVVPQIPSSIQCCGTLIERCVEEHNDSGNNWSSHTRCADYSFVHRWMWTGSHVWKGWWDVISEDRRKLANKDICLCLRVTVKDVTFLQGCNTCLVAVFGLDDGAKMFITSWLSPWCLWWPGYKHSYTYLSVFLIKTS